MVQPDDTLWAIAGRTSPGRSSHAVVAEIRRLNGLAAGDSTIYAGDTLIVPRGR